MALTSKLSSMQRLIEINSSYLQNHLPKINRADVGFGLGGATLFQLYKYWHQADPTALDQCRQYFDAMLEVLQKSENRTSLFIELTETAFFVRKYGAAVDTPYELEDLLEQLDTSLVPYAKSLLDHHWVDPYVGAFNQAFYFLHYPAIFYKEIEYFIDYLQATIKVPRKGHFYVENKQMPGIHLGITHGQAFFLVFLAKAFEAGIRKSTCLHLLKGISQFVLGHKLGQDPLGQLFPNTVGSTDFTRMGLAYGDLGTLYGLLRAAQALEDQALYQQVINWFEQCAQRKSFAATGIKHHNLLYGKAGPALCFQWLYQQTGEVSFLDTSEYWYLTLEKALRQMEPGDLTPFDDFDYPAMQQSSLLEGLTGSLIAIMAKECGKFDFNHLFYFT